MIKKDVWEASDGSWFATEEACENYEKWTELEKWYEENTLFGDSSKVSFDDLVDWIRENKDHVRLLVKLN